MLSSQYEHPSQITADSETQFVHNCINLESNVLEYGSGRSTMELSKIARSVVSVEHQKAWHDELSKELPKNVNLILAEPDLDYIEGPHANQRSEGNDGTYEEFETYIKLYVYSAHCYLSPKVWMKHQTNYEHLHCFGS